MNVVFVRCVRRRRATGVLWGERDAFLRARDRKDLWLVWFDSR
jgi:hypothetical protein